MIGVGAKLSDQEVVREFFELFKTEWEFEQSGVDYDVIIRSACDFGGKSNARLVIIYGADIRATSFLRKVRTVCRGDRILLFNKDRLPIYGSCLTFPDSSENDIVDEFTRNSVIVRLTQQEHQTVLWIGYDLWEEIRLLLLNGQPELYAEIPALELHIELLRGLLLQHNVPFAEVPPIPAGYKFIACLTHDVDHASIRAHKVDRTIVGFLYRAVVQSLFQFCSGRKSLGDLLRNWFAAISLPFVQVGLLPDIWSLFENYGEIEQGLPSTFFVVTKPGVAGRLRDGSAAPKMRAVRYTLAKISRQLRRLLQNGHEIALHGINAWLTENEANMERAELQKAINEANSTAVVGVRMHWLYYDQSSATALDQAGFHYDSTVGYNRTIGYRSGTCQVYKAIGTERLKELPLHAMDTALLFPSYMNLTPAQAKAKIRLLIANAVRFGGVLTINWHDRSIAPERLWHRLYADIIAELKDSGAWFATASRAVEWFERRRAVKVMETVGATSASTDELPGLTIKSHLPLQSVGVAA
jgi:peptidoglycan/xylan/chitin deacetylase (PgdA/CDA1 family)